MSVVIAKPTKGKEDAKKPTSGKSQDASKETKTSKKSK